jgi:hypothetical protein
LSRTPARPQRQDPILRLRFTTRLLD